MDFPYDLVRSIRAGDCVLWAGAGLGTLAGRPGWAKLLEQLALDYAPHVRSQLSDLLEQGRLRTVLSYVHRHSGEEPLLELLRHVSSVSDANPFEPGASHLGEIPFRAVFATTYADIVYQLYAQAGINLDVVSHTDAHALSLREHLTPFILRTPPTGRSMRTDTALFELVEEVVRTRTILFLGFDIDDPDFYQVLDLLNRIGRGRRHYAVLSAVSEPEAEEMLEQYGISVVRQALPLATILERMAAASQDVRDQPSTSEQDAAVLDVMRALAGVDLRADLALDLALTLDIREIETLLDCLPQTMLTEIDPRALLRAGAVLLAHDRWDRARRCFQQVASGDAVREFQNIARFNLAHTSYLEGDMFAAVEGFSTVGEHDRALSLVPPRFHIVELLGRDGTRLLLSCRDRETGQHLDIAVSTLGRPVSKHEQKRFYEQVQRAMAVSHATLPRVRGGFADQRLFGVMTDPASGFVLEDTLRNEPTMSIERTFELMGPLLDGLASCHAAGVVHRNIHPRQISITSHGPILRGFGFPPVISYHRPSVRHVNAHYAAPELSGGVEPSASSDVYSIAAVFYRCLTGHAPVGSVPRPTEHDDQLDPRIDALLLRALDRDPARRPIASELQRDLIRVLTSPPQKRSHEHAAAHLVSPSSPTPLTPEAAPEPPEPSISAPQGLRIVPPADPEDLDAWAWILERKPMHLEARAAVERIERQARDRGQWDRVTEALMARAQHAQVQSERVALLRELAGVFEHELGAPANAFATLQALAEEAAVPVQIELADDLVRLAGLAGSWTELATFLRGLAERAPEATTRARLYGELARVYEVQLGSLEQALGAYTKANVLVPGERSYANTLVELHRRLDHPRELVEALLAAAALESGAKRQDHLVEAIRSSRAQGDLDTAWSTFELAAKDTPNERGLLTLGEEIARLQSRWEQLFEILVRRAELASNDDEHVALRKHAATLAIEQLNDERRAIEQYQRMLERRRDKDTASRLAILLRRSAVGDLGQRGSLIDVLGVLIELCTLPSERVELLAESADLLDAQPDAATRAADCRAQIVAMVPLRHPLAVRSARYLEGHYHRLGAHSALAGLYQRILQTGEPDAEEQIRCWKELLELRKGPLVDESGVVEALEALVGLDKDNPRWRDELVERRLVIGDHQRARSLLEQALEQAEDVREQASMLVRLAKLCSDAGDSDRARHALERATALDPSQARAWLALRDVYEQDGQIVKALDAQVRAAECSPTRNETIHLLFSAADTWLERVGDDDRGLALLDRVVELDPDHHAGTRLLLARLVKRGELVRAWPIAQRFVAQVQALGPTNRDLTLHALGVASRCALAADDRERAREFLERALRLEPNNDEMMRQLADLDMAMNRWGDALTGYQALAMSATGEPGPKSADIYVMIARCRMRLREPAKAIQMIDRALELDRTYEPAILLSVELADTAGSASDRVRTRLALEAALADRGDNSSSERLAILREVAEIQVELMNRPERALETLRRVLELQPGDPAALHRMLDLHTQLASWTDATEILGELIAIQQESLTRAKYLYAGAVIFRDELRDIDTAIEWLRRVLEADPLHERGYHAAIELLSRGGFWHEVTRVIRARLKALPQRAEERVHLFEHLARVCGEKMHDPNTAIAVYEQVLAIEPDEAAQVEHRRTILNHALELGADGIDKAIAHGHALIASRPAEFPIYHRLFDLYLQHDQSDRASSIAKTLKFLKQATERELELADTTDATTSQIRMAVSRELWRQYIVHPLENTRLSDLFSLVWPMIAAREGRVHQHFGVQRDQRIPVEAESNQLVARSIAHACQVLDTSVPDVFVRPGEPGEIAVAAVAEGPGEQATTIYPTLFCRDDSLARQLEPGLMFRAGRAVARVRPEHILSSVLPTGASLRNAVYGAISITHPSVAIPRDCMEQAHGYGQEIERYLAPARLEQLRLLVLRVIEEGGADTRTWAVGVEHTVTRAGFVLCDSLEVSARVLTQEPDEPGNLTQKDRVKDLVSYSVSEAHLQLRSALYGVR